MNIINGIEIEDFEVVGIFSIISNLIIVFLWNVLIVILNEFFFFFVNCFIYFICFFGWSVVLEEVFDKDDMVYMEVYDKLLEFWLILV